MPSGLNTRNLTHGSIALADGAGTPNTLAVALDSGDLSFTRSKQHATILQRGVLDHQSRGMETPVQLSFSIPFSQYSSKSTQAVGVGPVTDFSVKDFLLNGGSLLTSTNGRTDVFATNITFTIADHAISGDENEILNFDDFVCDDVAFSEGEEFNTVTFTGTALLVEPGSTRV